MYYFLSQQRKLEKLCYAFIDKLCIIRCVLEEHVFIKRNKYSIQQKCSSPSLTIYLASGGKLFSEFVGVFPRTVKMKFEIAVFFISLNLSIREVLRNLQLLQLSCGPLCVRS